MRVTALIENSLLEGREDLIAEFGLSLHIQRGEHVQPAVQQHLQPHPEMLAPGQGRLLA